MRLVRKTSVQVVAHLNEEEATKFEKVAKKLRTTSVSETIRAMIDAVLRGESQ